MRIQYTWKAIIFWSGSFSFSRAVLGDHQTEFNQALSHVRSEPHVKMSVRNLGVQPPETYLILCMCKLLASQYSFSSITGFGGKTVTKKQTYLYTSTMCNAVFYSKRHMTLHINTVHAVHCCWQSTSSSVNSELLCRKGTWAVPFSTPQATLADSFFVCFFTETISKLLSLSLSLLHAW